MKLENIRRKIDEIDLDLLALLEERMELGLRVRRFKTSATDPRREETVLNRAMRSSLALVEAEFAERLFSEIIGESKRLQDTGRRLVAFQGEHGAYSEMAARRLVPGAAYLPCREFATVFDGVAEGHYDLGAVPVENSLEGTISPVNELLARTGLKVVGEAHVPIRHCLLTQGQGRLADLRVVYSHPQALAQCRNYLASRELEARPFSDTAGAARMLAHERPRATGVIASSLAAELFGLHIAEEAVADSPGNTTRFLLLGAESSAEAGDKCSIVFVTPHEAGSLYRVLSLFAEAGINLSRIASMPYRDDPANYVFFLDLEASDREPRVAEVLAQVAVQAVSYRFLGCYRSGPRPASPPSPPVGSSPEAWWSDTLR